MVRRKLKFNDSNNYLIIFNNFLKKKRLKKLKNLLITKYSLPNFIKLKLKNINLKLYSTISLFNSIFYHYPSEDVYSDGIELPLPTIDLELKETLNDEL